MKYTFFPLLILILLTISTNASASYESINFNYENQQAGVLSLLLNLISPTSNAQTPDITTGLVGHWTFDEGSGTTAGDSSGNNNMGTFTNGPTWTTGKIGQALSFDGTNDKVQITNGGTGWAEDRDAITISFWIKVKNIANFDGAIAQGNWGSNYIFFYTSSNTWVTAVRSTNGVGGGDRCSMISPALGYLTTTDNTFHHVVLTCDFHGSVGKLYSDNVEIGSDAFLTGQADLSTGGDLFIGGFGTNAEINAEIDDVRIYNRALSAGEITELYNYTGDTTPPPTCTSFTYSTWSPTTCPVSQTQTRTITSSLPSGCLPAQAGTEGTSTTTQSCTYIQPQPDTDPPTVPTNLSATPTSSSQINLTWSASTDNVYVTSYNIYRCIGSSCTPTFLTTSSTNSYSDTGLTQSTTYSYTVSAYDAVPNTSIQSAQVSVVTNSAGSIIPPEFPREYMSTTYIQPTGSTFSVCTYGCDFSDFQTALDNSSFACGDTLELGAGESFIGDFILPNKGDCNGNYMIIRGSNESTLPPEGTRINPSIHAANMPKLITSTGNGTVLWAKANVNHYRFIGIEMTTNYHDSGVLVFIGSGRGGSPIKDTSYEMLPHHFIFDRVYIHGNPTGDVRAGSAMDGAYIAFIDSYISEIHERGPDTQALIAINGAGPFKIVNNYIEAAGENVMFGGGDPSITGLVPSDIEFKRNYVFKPLSWRQSDPSYAGEPWRVKNLFEIKNARRVLIEGNIFENNWVDGQTGTAIVFTPRSQYGNCSWCSAEDIVFQNNIVRHVTRLFSIVGEDWLYPGSPPSRRILIRNNLFEDVDSVKWGNGSGYGRLYQFNNALGNISDIEIDHNTGFQSAQSIVVSGTNTDVFNTKITNNIFKNDIHGDGVADDNSVLNEFFSPQIDFRKNVIYQGSASDIPDYPDNFFPASVTDIGFVDYSGGDYRLSAASLYKNAGTDGKDIGADIDKITSAIYNNTTPPLSADLNSDGTVNSLDWSIMNAVWNTNDATADINNDGIVNTIDWSIMNNEWN